MDPPANPLDPDSVPGLAALVEESTDALAPMEGPVDMPDPESALDALGAVQLLGSLEAIPDSAEYKQIVFRQGGRDVMRIQSSEDKPRSAIIFVDVLKRLLRAQVLAEEAATEAATEADAKKRIGGEATCK